MDLSFVIPAFNEEQHIGNTLLSIRGACEGRWNYEIWVVDNGSRDGTRARAAELGGKVVQQPGGTIAGLRNLGASRAHGRYLVFLDADVTLESNWADLVSAWVFNRAPGRLALAGSSCSVPHFATWIEKAWFARRNESASSHIGSAHMIIGRKEFASLGGFNPGLETGEDYELCQRVVAAGGEIVRLPSSVVTHHGYPKNLLQFMRREIWHGEGDSFSLRAAIQSPVSRAALAFAGLHVVSVCSALAGRLTLAAGAALSVMLLCFAAASRTFRGESITVRVTNTALYYVYFAARTLSFITVWTRLRPRASERPTVVTTR